MKHMPSAKQKDPKHNDCLLFPTVSALQTLLVEAHTLDPTLQAQRDQLCLILEKSRQHNTDFRDYAKL